VIGKACRTGLKCIENSSQEAERKRLLVLWRPIRARVLYPARSQWGTYHGCCSKRDRAQTSVKMGSWASHTTLAIIPTSSVQEFLRHKQ
jgi:hypothetical protein